MLLLLTRRLMRCDGRTPFTPTRSSRALGALRMRILKVMTLSVMHKDHSLHPNRILHVQPLRTVRTGSFICAGGVLNTEQLTLVSPQPPSRAEPRSTDGPEEAAPAIARTVTREHGGARHTNTLPLGSGTARVSLTWLIEALSASTRGRDTQ